MTSTEISQRTAFADQQLREQTGLSTGCPTGFCHPFLLMALTGKILNVQNHPTTYYEQMTTHQQFLTDFRARIYRGNTLLPTPETLEALLEQEVIPLTAILVEGSRRVRWRSGSHISALVVLEDKPGQVAAVDSLIPGGLTLCINQREINQCLRDYDGKRMEFAILPADSQLAYPGEIILPNNRVMKYHKRLST